VIHTERVIAAVDVLPTLPASVSRLAALLADDDSTIADFARVIRPDLALTANLLRVANSAFAAPRKQLTTVEQAASWLGRKRLLEVCVSGAFHCIVPATLPGYGMDASAFWHHSVAVAVLGEQLARHLRRDISDTAFTAGLLHDVGKLIISSFLLEVADEVSTELWERDAAFIDVEGKLFGTDHAEVGSMVAERWGLPVGITEVARWHHRPSELPNSDGQVVVDCVHVADAIAHVFGLGADLGELARSIDPGALERLGVSASDVDRVAAESFERISEMTELLVWAGKSG
jgi:putative nucleotidyltransferase with HDIG domain